MKIKVEDQTVDKQLKIFALNYVKEHDNLTKEQKLGVAEFIMEASDEQVKFLLTTGEVKDKLTEEDNKLLKKRINEGGFDNIIATIIDNLLVSPVETSGVLISVSALIAAVGVASMKVYQIILSKAARTCKGKSGNEKISCFNKFKRDAQTAKIKALQLAISKCSKTKNPSSCKNKLQSKINKEKSKIGV